MIKKYHANLKQKIPLAASFSSNRDIFCNLKEPKQADLAISVRVLVKSSLEKRLPLELLKVKKNVAFVRKVSTIHQL